MHKDTYNYEVIRNHFDGELRDRVLNGADYLRQSGHGSTVIMDGSDYSPCFRAILPPGMDEWFMLADTEDVENVNLAYDAAISRAHELASEHGVALEESEGMILLHAED